MSYPDNFSSSAFDAAQGVDLPRWKEQELAAMVAEEMVEISKYRLIIATAIRDLNALDFKFGFPVDGYELRDVIGDLSDFMPPAEPKIDTRLRREAMAVVREMAA